MHRAHTTAQNGPGPQRTARACPHLGMRAQCAAVLAPLVTLRAPLRQKASCALLAVVALPRSQPPFVAFLLATAQALRKQHGQEARGPPLCTAREPPCRAAEARPRRSVTAVLLPSRRHAGPPHCGARARAAAEAALGDRSRAHAVHSPAAVQGDEQYGHGRDDGGV